MTKFRVEDINLEGWDTIHKAAYCGNYDKLLEELNNGICANSIVENFKSINHPFLKKRHPIYFNNMTPLYLAAQRGNSKCVQLLIDRGADPTIMVKNTFANEQCTAMNLALWFYNFNCYWIMKNSIKKDTKKDTKKQALLSEPYGIPNLDSILIRG